MALGVDMWIILSIFTRFHSIFCHPDKDFCEDAYADAYEEGYEDVSSCTVYRPTDLTNSTQKQKRKRK